MRRIEPYLPLSHGIPGVDDKRVLSGIIFVIRTGLRWRDAPRDYGPHKTIYNRFICWSRLGLFNRIVAELSARGTPARATDDRRPSQSQDHAGRPGYDAGWFRAALIRRGITPCIPSKANRTVQIDHDQTLYRHRHKIENMFGRLKDW